MPVGRGISNDEIRVGIGWLDASGAQSACDAAGWQGDCSADVDVRGWAAKVVGWLNERGGIAGREIVPLYYRWDISESLRAPSRSAAEQSACAHWTEDNEVFAMIPTVSFEGVLLECARQTGTVFLGTTQGEVVVDSQRYAEMGNLYYRPNWILADRREEMMVDALVREDFFGQGARVGLLVWDQPSARRAAERALEPALAAQGIDVVSRAYYPDQIESPWATYVLNFQAAGVTHVLFGAGLSSGPVWFFAQQAESQRYEPKYAFGSDQEPRKVVAQVKEIVPRTTVIGWHPIEDQGPDKRPKPLNDAERQCDEIIREPLYSPAYCEGLFFLKRALDTADALTPDGMAAVVEGLGDSYVSPLTYATRFGPGRHTGLAAVAPLTWSAACECLVPKRAPYGID